MQVSRSEGGTLLPWPNGSLLSGRLMPPETGSGAMLMLGNYRVRIEVPPNIPMGKIWLQLLQREMPGQFRVLTEKQAILFIAEMLDKNKDKPELFKALQTEQQQKQQGKDTWLKFPVESLPFMAEQFGERLMLLHPKHQQPQGFVQKEEEQNGFMLHGRLDLEHLGALAFALEGRDGEAWKVHIHLENKALKQEVEQQFLAWLQGKEKQSKLRLEGAVFDAIPESMGSHSERKV